MTEQELRLECLKLANNNGDPEDMVLRAAAYADFVLSGSGVPQPLADLLERINARGRPRPRSQENTLDGESVPSPKAMQALPWMARRAKIGRLTGQTPQNGTEAKQIYETWYAEWCVKNDLSIPEPAVEGADA